MKPVIIAIVGRSGSGKTYMAEFLRKKMNIPTIVSYTTRRKRPGETDGVEHFFIGSEQVPEGDDMLAYTVFGGEQYFALHSQVPKDGICTYVIDEAGLECLVKDFGNRYLIVPVAVKCSEETLIKRGIEPDRLARDKRRIHINDSFYDCIIINDGTIEEFENKILSEINKL